MKVSLHDYMKVGIVHFMAYPSTIGGDGPVSDTVAEIVNDDFFDAIELTRINDEKEKERVKTLLASSGVAIGFGAQPMLLRGKLNLNSFDEAERQEAVETMKTAVDMAYEVGAGKLGFLSGRRPEDPKRVDEALQLLTDSIITIGRYAKSKGDLVLSLETFDDSTDKCALAGTNKLSVEIAKEVRRAISDFGLMVDLSHLPMQGETVREALSVTEEYINHAHIGSCVVRDVNDPAYGDKHPRFGYPGGESGVAEIREFLAGLLDIGYLQENAPERNIVAFEVFPIGNEESRPIVAEAKRYLREAWRTL